MSRTRRAKDVEEEEDWKIMFEASMALTKLLTVRIDVIGQFARNRQRRLLSSLRQTMQATLDDWLPLSPFDDPETPQCGTARGSAEGNLGVDSTDDSSSLEGSPECRRVSVAESELETQLRAEPGSDAGRETIEDTHESQVESLPSTACSDFLGGGVLLSLGSRDHCKATCHPCRFQDRHLRNPELHEPCNNGVGCNSCHHLHTLEYVRAVKMKCGRIRKQRKRLEKQKADIAQCELVDQESVDLTS